MTRILTSECQRYSVNTPPSPGLTAEYPWSWSAVPVALPKLCWADLISLKSSNTGSANYGHRPSVPPAIWGDIVCLSVVICLPQRQSWITETECLAENICYVALYRKSFLVVLNPTVHDLSPVSSHFYLPLSSLSIWASCVSGLFLTDIPFFIQPRHPMLSFHLTAFPNLFKFCF